METIGPVPNPNKKPVSDLSLDDVMKDSNSRAFRELRDRAAYVRITGGFPTHLRTHMNALLGRITRYTSRPISMDGRIAGMAIDPQHIQKLGLDDHPMIRKVQSYIAQGYVIQLPRDPKARRPFSRVALALDSHHLTVQEDGSVIEG